MCSGAGEFKWNSNVAVCIFTPLPLYIMALEPTQSQLRVAEWSGTKVNQRGGCINPASEAHVFIRKRFPAGWKDVCVQKGLKDRHVILEGYTSTVFLLWLKHRAQPKPLELKHRTGSVFFADDVWTDISPGQGAQEKRLLRRSSRVKTFCDICFWGHSIPARINVLPAFNFTWAGPKSKHSWRVITFLGLDQLVTGLWTPQQGAQGNHSPISLQIPLGYFQSFCSGLTCVHQAISLHCCLAKNIHKVHVHLGCR